MGSGKSRGCENCQENCSDGCGCGCHESTSVDVEEVLDNVHNCCECLKCLKCIFDNLGLSPNCCSEM